MPSTRSPLGRGLAELLFALAGIALVVAGALLPGASWVALIALVPLVALAWLRFSLQARIDDLAEFLAGARARPAPTPEKTGAAAPRLPPSLAGLGQGVEGLLDEMRREARSAKALGENLTGLVASAREAMANLEQGFGEEREHVTRAGDAILELSGALKDIAVHVETLATAAEESSSSILEMTTTNEEVAENMALMGNSVRETVSSIGEMAYSVKEVAKNIDALSTTAEETSSAMREMDVSIDEVQSSANETTQLSEHVARDAERAADAVVKTLNVIQQIKHSSQEAVNVISNLGQKIEAIGQILNVIDDVAEQTNLLALNAAIIAAQAGEHGKGFAVVADEIKDLAERSGVSTKEIAELIKGIQSESRNAIAAVERGNTNVDQGVKVSVDAEQALRQILDSSRKSTAMMHTIARATVEQARGSKQVTDAFSRIAETVQQIATATAQQARGSELIIKGAEKMRSITQHVERSTQEQAKGGRQITTAIESISKMVNQLNLAHRQQQLGNERILELSGRVQRISREQQQNLEQVKASFETVERAVGK
jgi:methyl-accepting chemotaxis protein